jgi:mono/diheme cytochrome c family protein
MRMSAGLARAPLIVALLALASSMLMPSMRVAAAGTPPITVSFDHFSTGFELDGVHRDLPCESCHLNAVFRGTPRTCGLCHITGSVYNATPKTQTHIQSSNNCVACHNTISFRPDVHFDHRDVMGNCVNCHNGTIAQGEGPTHPKSSNACDACHTTLSWNPPKAVDHTQFPLAVQGFCIICHNGVQASGKTPDHIATNLECGDCHLTTTWLGATFDHTGIKTGCFSCHNGTKAVGKQGSHMPTSNLCESCHTTGLGSKAPSWAPSAFDHTQMTTVNTCLPCHNGTVKITTGFVSGLPTNHVPLSSATPDCVLCHGNNPAAETWTVLAADIPTLHTKLNTTNCLMCHGGETFAGVPAPFIPMAISGVSPYKKAPLAPPHIPVLAGTDCSACHGPAYRSGGFGPATAMSAATHKAVSSTCDVCHDTGKSFYMGSGTPLQLRPADHLKGIDPRMATGDCSLCHSTTDWNSTALPTGHMPNPGNQGCTTCHTAIGSTEASYATLASVAVLHAGITGNCSQCHGNYTAALTWYNNYTPKDAILTPSHIPYLVGTDCSSCHASNYVTGGFGPTNMSAAKHAFVPTTCDTCHDGATTFYLGASTPATLQKRPASHLSSGNAQQISGDCSACHNTTNWNTTALPAGHMPNPGSQACTVCHTSAPANYNAYASLPILHTGITTGCVQCHGGATPLTFYNNHDNPLAAPATHIPSFTGNDCSACHTAKYTAGGFGPMNMTQATHVSVSNLTCVTCHEAGRSFYMGAANPKLQTRPADHNSGTMLNGDCGGCHSTANWNSTNLPSGHMPNPGNQGCTVCHVGAPSNYKTLAANSVLHTGIGSGCITCHGAPNTTAPVFANSFTPKAASGLAPPHIPSAATPCENCHSLASFTSFSGTTMSAAKHTLLLADTGGTCDQCHEIGKAFYGVNNLTVRPGANHGRGQDCNGCHSPNNWNGAQKRKTAAAPATTKTTVGIVANPGIAGRSVNTGLLSQSGVQLRGGGVLGDITRVNHAGVVANCVSCHNGVLATGKGPLHIASNNTCENCHTTLAWMPAHFDHRGVTATCVSCHNGVTAPGKPTRHIQTNQDCSACHGTIAWTPANFNHLGINAACQSCHNGVAATAKQIGHIPTTLDCGSCHSTLNWTTTITSAPQKPLISRPKPSPRPGAVNGPTK